MKIYLDTSSLFKLYHQEEDSLEIEQVFIRYEVQTVYLSEITKLEFASAVWKKVRLKQLSEDHAGQLIQAFEFDFPNYAFVQLDTILVEKAKNLLSLYGKSGLRTLDSLQLATAVLLKNQVELVKTSDQLLLELFEAEGLPTRTQHTSN